MSEPWPSTPLAAAERAFDLLTCPPTPLSLDCRAITGMPPTVLPLNQVKRTLTSSATPRPVRDLVWRELVIRARRDGPAWVVAAVGVAMPGLRRTAGMLARGWRGDIADLDAELLAGFLQRLGTVDLDEPRICGRLVDAGARAVKQARDREAGAEFVRVARVWTAPPPEPWDHPDWLLSRAVAAAVIDPDEFLLIAWTRLDHLSVQVVADRLGVEVEVARAWRRKAERRLVDAIGGGELDWSSLLPKGRKVTDAARPAGAAG
ncbi:hypothetical protein [Polymorphospora sp. NPDC050346]|uniref:hypothetical protein n=1 Tax=Polymorphospora sp. NPDC050346 TaxID=3155780 RepID=UPI0033C7D701